MEALLLCWLTFTGLGALAPSLDKRGMPGVRLWAGATLMLVIVFVLNVGAGVGLRLAAQATALLAGAGLGLAFWRARRNPPSLAALLHPALVLPLAALVVIAWRGGVGYEPLAWDELNNWLGWTRQAVAFDSLDDPRMVNPVRGYTPGWPIALAFPNLLLGRMDESLSAVVPLLLHVAVLGLVFDVAARMLDRAGWAAPSARLGAWALILGALAVEATWKLAPTNLLIEKPQIYALCAVLFLAVVATSRDVRPGRAGLHLGLSMVAGYLIKVSMLAFAPALAVIGLALCLLRRRAGEGLRAQALGAAMLALPMAVVYLLWTRMGAPQGCMSDPLAVFGALLGGQTDGQAGELLARFAGAELDYLRAFKLPLTLAAVAGLAVALTVPRLAIIPLALALYALVYFGALYAYHLSCFGAYYFQELNSVDRFTRVPLRTVHLAGLALPLLAMAPRLAGLAGRRAVVVALAVAVLALGAWQVRQLDRSFAAMAARGDADPDQVAVVRAMRAETGAALNLLDRHPGWARRPLMLAQGSAGYETVIANYFGLGRFRLADMWSWGPEPANVWMLKAEPEQVRATLLAASVVWPVIVDPWMRDVLAGLIRDPACLADPTRYLLVPDPQAGELACVPKARST